MSDGADGPQSSATCPARGTCSTSGHLNILLRAREQCDRLVVGVVTDEALFQAKGKHPVIPLIERMQVVAT